MNKIRLCFGLLLLLLTGVFLSGCSPEAKAKRHLARAEKFVQQRELESAELEALNVIRMEENNPVALNLLQGIYFEQGRVMKLAAVLNTLITAQTNNRPASLRLARIYRAFHETDKARQLVRQNLSADPRDWEALLILAEDATDETSAAEVREHLARSGQQTAPTGRMIEGVLAVNAGDLTGGERWFREAVRLNENLVEARQFLGWILWLRGDTAEADTQFGAAAGLSRNDPFNQLRWALLKIRAGDMEGASKIIDSILGAYPEFLPAQAQSAVVAFEQRRYEDCEKLVTKVLAQDRNLFVPLQLQARLKLLRGAVDESIRDLERLAERYPQLAQIHFYLAVAYLQKPEVAAARKSLERAVAADPTFSEAILVLSELEIQGGRVGGAVAMLERLVQQRPKQTKARIMLAEAYRARGEMPKLIGQYEALVGLAPNNPQARVLLGLAYRQQRQMAPARQSFEGALAASPGYLPAVGQLVELDLEAGQIAASSNRVVQLLATRKDSPEIHFLMGRIQLAAQSVDEAEASFKQAIELRPDFASAYDALANIYAGSKRESQALAQLEELAGRRPNDTRVLMQLGILHERLKQPQKAIAAYERVLQGSPDFITALNNLAYLYGENGGDLDKALQLARKAAQLSKDNHIVLDTLGWVLYRRGEIAAAAEVLRGALAKSPENPEYHYHYGLACYRLGLFAPARDSLARAARSTREFSGKADVARYLVVAEIASAPLDQDSVRRLESLRAKGAADDGLILLLADAYQAVKDPHRAAQVLEKHLRDNSGSPALTVKLAGLLAANPEQTASAREWIKKALGVGGRTPQMNQELGRALFQLGDFSQATKLLQEAAGLRLPGAGYDLAVCQFWGGDAVSAESTLRQVLQSGGNEPSPEEVRWLASILRSHNSPRTGEIDAAQVTAMLQRRPDWPPARLAEALSHQRRGETNQAAAAYQSFLRQRPLFVPGHRAFARFLLENSGDLQLAESLMESTVRIVALDPVSAGVYGELLQRSGKTEAALKQLREAVRAGVTNPRVHYALGFAADKAGDKVQAKRSLLQALTLDGRNPLSSEARGILERYEAEARTPGRKSP